MLKEFKVDIKGPEQLYFYVFRFDLGQVCPFKKEKTLIHALHGNCLELSSENSSKKYAGENRFKTIATLLKTKLARGCLAGHFSDFLRTAF